MARAKTGTSHGAELLELSNPDPEACLSAAADYLEQLGDHDPAETALTLRAMSNAAKLLDRLDEAIEFAERAIAAATETGDTSHQVLALHARASALTLAGRLTEALEIVEASLAMADTPYLRARCSYQRAAVLNRMGDKHAAIDALESAAGEFRDSGDEMMLGNTLKGLGLMRLEVGDLDRSHRALTEALELAIRRNELPAISGIRHNLGLLASYRGDIPTALQHLTVSDEIYMEVTGSPAPQHVARCEVLLSAGLFEEARDLAVRVVEARLATGDFEHLDEARLVAARAALAAGDPEAAVSLAGDAFESLKRQGKRLDAWRAKAIQVQALYEAHGASTSLLGQATDTGDGLADDPIAFASASLLLARVALDLGRDDTAHTALKRVADIGHGPAELRIQSWLAKARLRLLDGDTRRADAAVRSGLRMIDDYQAALGSTDLRMGIERHSAELGTIGLGLAFRSKRPRRVLAWMERTRGRSLRYRPSNDWADAEVHGTLAELRRVEMELRDPEMRADRTLAMTRRRLQDRIADAARTRRGRDQALGDVHVDEIITRLGGRSLVEFGHDGDRLVAVVVRDGTARLLRLSPRGEVASEAGHLRFAMRRSARMGRVFDLSELGRLDELLLGSVPDLGEEIVVVPTPDLMAMPWSVLPTLLDCNITVTPSAEIWWRARTNPVPAGGAAIIGGPDLDFAAEEVRSIAALYPRPRVMPENATVEVVRAAMTDVKVAHIASHAQFNAQNPMFSSLRLADGDLNVYDIEGISPPPGLVVLSACDSGYSEARAGEELAGLTSALLTMGTKTIIASVGLVPDTEATRELMVALHRALIGGKPPARALRLARQTVLDKPGGLIAAASFVCVGSG